MKIYGYVHRKPSSIGEKVYKLDVSGVAIVPRLTLHVGCAQLY